MIRAAVERDESGGAFSACCRYVAEQTVETSVDMSLQHSQPTTMSESSRAEEHKIKMTLPGEKD